MLALEFSDQVSVGNLITMGVVLTGGLGAYFDMRSYTRITRMLIEQLEKRFDAVRIEQMRERVDTMWAFQIRRGITELEQRGLGKMIYDPTDRHD